MNDLWLITEDGWRAYLARMLQRAPMLKALMELNPLNKGDRKKLRSISAEQEMQVWYDDEDEDDDGNRLPSMYTLAGAYRYMVEEYNNVAVLRISGDLVPEYVWYNRYMDSVSYPEIISCCDHLHDRAAAGIIDTVVVAFDTPGGAVHGIETAANALEELGKKVKLISHAETQMTSGGVWLGVSAPRVSANRMAVVASIGVIAVHMSYNRMLKEAGIDATVMRSGSEKALGTPYEELTPEAKAIRQESMDLVHEEFRTRVQKGRGLTRQQILDISTGRSWMAFQPEVSTLIDEVTTLDAVVQRHVAVHNPTHSAPTFSMADSSVVRIVSTGTGSMKVKVLNAKGQAAVAAGLSVEDAMKDSTMFELREAVSDEEGGSEGDGTGDKPKDGEDDSDEEDGEEPGKKDDDADKKVAAPAFSDQLSEALKANGRLEAKVESLNEQITSLKAAGSLKEGHVANLEKIALAAVNKMEVALGVATSEASGAALVERYADISGRFEQRFKVGAQAKRAIDENLSQAAVVSDEQEELKRRLNDNK